MSKWTLEDQAALRYQEFGPPDAPSMIFVHRYVPDAPCQRETAQLVIAQTCFCDGQRATDCFARLPKAIKALNAMQAALDKQHAMWDAADAAHAADLAH